MITVIEVKKNLNETNINLIRRFNRKVQESGIVQNVKRKRYKERTESKVKLKSSALKKLANRKAYEKLFKMGKAVRSSSRSGKTNN